MKIRSFIFFFFVSGNIFGQGHFPKAMTDYIKQLNLRPLNKVDTFSKVIPENITTESNWHLDYYARIIYLDGPGQLDVYEMIYNDSIFCSTWHPYNTMKKIEYNFIEFKEENSKFLYFDMKGAKENEYLFIVSKTKNDLWFEFSNILYKDVTNGIYIETSPEYSAEEGTPLIIEVTNINTGKTERVKFDGTTEDISNCVRKVTYVEGKLSIDAHLMKKKTKEPVTMTKSIKI